MSTPQTQDCNNLLETQSGVFVYLENNPAQEESGSNPIDDEPDGKNGNSPGNDA